MSKKPTGKRPSFDFYPGDWLKDPAVRRCSFRAKGVWIDLIAVSFGLPEPGCFRDSNGPFPDDEIIEMLTGNARERRVGFSELSRKGVFKRLEDGSLYIKRIHELWRISEIRSESGSKGGNPNLVRNLDNQSLKQTLNQNPTPSSSSSFSSSDKELNQREREAKDQAKSSHRNGPKIDPKSGHPYVAVTRFSTFEWPPDFLRWIGRQKHDRPWTGPSARQEAKAATIDAYQRVTGDHLDGIRLDLAVAEIGYPDESDVRVAKAFGAEQQSEPEPEPTTDADLPT